MTRIVELTRKTRQIGDSVQAATISRAGRYKFDLLGDLPNATLDDTETDIELALYHEIDGTWRHVASVGYKGGTNPSRLQPRLSFQGDIDANTRVQTRLTVRRKSVRVGVTLDATEIV